MPHAAPRFNEEENENTAIDIYIYILVLYHIICINKLKII